MRRRRSRSLAGRQPRRRPRRDALKPVSDCSPGPLDADVAAVLNEAAIRSDQQAAQLPGDLVGVDIGLNFARSLGRADRPRLATQ